MIALQHEKGYPDNRVTSDPIAVLFVLQTQDKGYPDNRVTSDPIAVLFVLQEEEEERERSAAARENIQPPTDVGEKSKNLKI